MNKLTVLVSAGTAFVISAGGSLGVVALSGYTITTKAVVCACIVGAVTAAKDTRSLLKLPPVETPDENSNPGVRSQTAATTETKAP